MALRNEPGNNPNNPNNAHIGSTQGISTETQDILTTAPLRAEKFGELLQKLNDSEFQAYMQMLIDKITQRGLENLDENGWNQTSLFIVSLIDYNKPGNQNNGFLWGYLLCLSCTPMFHKIDFDPIPDYIGTIKTTP